MAFLEELILSGRIVDIALALLVFELLAIGLIRRTRGGAVPLMPLLVSAGAGGSLMLALRAALTNASWQTIAAFLALALLFHAADVAQRWQRPGRNIE